MIGLAITLFIVVWIIGKIPFFLQSGLKPWCLRTLFVIKVAVGCVLLHVYSSYYTEETSDMYIFFKDGNIMYSVLEKSPADYLSILTGIGGDRPHMMEYYDSMSHWLKPFDDKIYNDNKIIIRLNGVIRIFSRGNIYIHLVVFNFLSFIGLIGFCRFASEFVSRRKKTLIVLFSFLMPSVLVWSSGMLKESVLIFALGIAVWLLYKTLFKKVKWYNLLILAFTIVLLSLIKFYVFLSLIPSLIWFCYYRFRPRKMLLSYIVIHAILALLAFNFHWLFNNYDLMKMIATKQHDFINMITYLTEAGSAISLPYLDGSLLSMLKAIPYGLYNSFCRPHIFEWHNILALISAVENLILNVTMIGSLIFAKLKNFKSAFILISISFVFILFSIIGITTPVLGALVRYKMPGLLFLGATMVMIVDPYKIKKIVEEINSKLATKLNNSLTKLTDLMII